MVTNSILFSGSGDEIRGPEMVGGNVNVKVAHLGVVISADEDLDAAIA